jgi:hypothetical protein
MRRKFVEVDRQDTHTHKIECIHSLYELQDNKSYAIKILIL